MTDTSFQIVEAKIDFIKEKELGFNPSSNFFLPLESAIIYCL